MVWLDQNPDVIAWDYECVRIPYYYDDHKRWYVPDFIVTYSESENPVMYEIKPFELLSAEKVKLKREAAVKWCAENNFKGVESLTRSDLIEMGVDLKRRPPADNCLLTPEPEAQCRSFV